MNRWKAHSEMPIPSGPKRPLLSRHQVYMERRLAPSVIALLVIGGTVGACGGSGVRKQRATGACGLLMAHWNGQTRSLCTPAGTLGFAPATEVGLKVGQEVTLTTPRGGGSIAQNMHSSDTGVLMPQEPSSALAQFRGVSPGAADVIGQSRFCLSGNGADASCTVAHVVVTR